MEFEVGDIIMLKKKHPCGCYEWKVLRTGADFRIRCLGCGRQVTMSRKDIEKNLANKRKMQQEVTKR